MRGKFGIAVVVTLLVAPVAVHAQGVIGGMQRGAVEGSYAAGPVGGIVGGSVARWAARIARSASIHAMSSRSTIAGIIAIITTIAGTATPGGRRRCQVD